MIAMEEQYLTVKEVAKKIRKAPFTVRRYLREGTIPAIKLDDGTWLIAESDVDTYLVRRKYRKPEERK